MNANGGVACKAKPPTREPGAWVLNYFGLLKKVRTRRENQSFHHWEGHGRRVPSSTVGIQLVTHWDNWYASPFPNFLSVCILHAQ